MDISKKTFIWAIVSLVLLRVILVVLVMNNIPDTNMKAGGFRPTFTASYQPDEPQYIQLARGLISGKAEKLVPNIGAPLVFAPLIYFTGADSIAKLVPYVFILQAFFIFSLAIILIVLIGFYLFNSRKIALACAMLFVVYPWLLFGLFKIIGYNNAIPAFHYQLWIFILSDYLSAFWVYLSFFLIFKWFDIFKNSSINFKKIILIAVVSGCAILTRIGNFWLISIILLLFLYFKNFKKLIIYSGLLLLVYLPQLIFNSLAFGLPWVYGYRDKSVGASTSAGLFDIWFNPSNLWLNFSNFSPRYYFLMFLIAALFFIFIFFFGYKYFSKTNKKFAAIAVAWFWSYLIFYGLFDESLSQLRYFLSAIPVFIYFFIASIVYIGQKLYLKKQYV